MNFKNINIGIVQGRLTKSKELQQFPKNPFKEFYIAKKLGYKFIEIFTERKINKNNPIWSQSPNLYLQKKKTNYLSLFSACDDFVILNGFNKRYLVYIQSLVNNLSKLKINRLIIPLEQRSKVTNHNLKKIIFYLKKISKICSRKKIPYLLIESNCNYSIFEKIQKGVNSKNLFFLYDLGNRANYFPDVYKDILKFGKNIKHIHIKDKNSKSKNVIIGTGKVDFVNAFKAVKKIFNNDLAFVFENNRGANPEISAKKNLNFLKGLIQNII
tara:strand:- start:2051 stop:2860 length:810 start_codon:yes stop_codon:yes gene_type:complete